MLLLLLMLMSNTHTVSSGNDQYCLDISFRGGTVFEAEQFSLRDGKNMLVYTIYGPGVHTFYVSDHGTVFAMSEHHVVFYDRSGEPRTLVRFDYLNNGGFSEHGDLFYVSVQEGVYVYTLDGRSLFELMPGRLFASTKRGENIAVVSSDTLRLYSEGVLVQTIKLETAYVHRVSFTESGTVRVEGTGGMEVFDMMTGGKVEQ
jgi:hypothetical protein